MKKSKSIIGFALISFFVVHLFISCDKNEEESTDDNSNPFIGTWKQDYTSEAYYLITFNEDLSFEDEYHEHGYEQYDSGTYSFNSSKQVITFTDADETWSEDYEFTNSTTLIMSEDIYIKQ